MKVGEVGLKMEDEGPMLPSGRAGGGAARVETGGKVEAEAREEDSKPPKSPNSSEPSAFLRA